MMYSRVIKLASDMVGRQHQVDKTQEGIARKLWKDCIADGLTARIDRSGSSWMVMVYDQDGIDYGIIYVMWVSHNEYNGKHPIVYKRMSDGKAHKPRCVAELMAAIENDLLTKTLGRGNNARTQ